MDLVTFIPGVGATAAFTPGANTPAPFNVSHTGLTDGTSPATASSNMAEIYNRLLLQVASTIVHAGLTIDNTNWTQLSIAVQAIANNAVAGAVSGGGLETSAHAAATYETIVHAASTYQTLAAANALFTLTSTNVFVLSSGGALGGVTLPAGGTWRGIWLGQNSVGVANGYITSSDIFTLAGGTVVADTYYNVKVFATRIA